MIAILAALRSEQLGQPEALTVTYAVTVRALVAVIGTLNEQASALEQQMRDDFRPAPRTLRSSCPTSSRCWSRRPGPRSGSGAGSRPGTAAWSALRRRQVLKTGQPYTDLGADFYTRRDSPAQQHAYLEHRLQKLHPSCTITINVSPPPGDPPPGIPVAAD